MMQRSRALARTSRIHLHPLLFPSRRRSRNFLEDHFSTLKYATEGTLSTRTASSARQRHMSYSCNQREAYWMVNTSVQRVSRQSSRSVVLTKFSCTLKYHSSIQTQSGTSASFSSTRQTSQRNISGSPSKCTTTFACTGLNC